MRTKQSKKCGNNSFRKMVRKFNIKDKKYIFCSHDRVINDNELWIDVEIEKVIKHQGYSLEIKES